MGKKGLAVMKRPAAKSNASKGDEYWWSKEAEEEEHNEEQEEPPPAKVLKRPAGLKRPAADEEDNPEDTQNGNDPRHRMKQYYFEEAKKAGALSEQVLEAWEKAKGNRKQETAVVNSVMVPGPAGKRGQKFVPDPHAPAFQEVLVKFSRLWYAEKEKAVPKAIMVAKLGGPRYFDDALESGDIKEVQGQGGKSFYAYSSMEVTRETGKESRHAVKSGIALDDDSYAKLSDNIKSLEFSFAYSPAEQKALARKTLQQEVDPCLNTIRAETHKHRPQPLGA